GAEIVKIDLAQRSPFRVAVDSSDGSAWVAILRGPLLRFTKEGKTAGEVDVACLTVDADSYTGEAWVVTRDEVLRVNRKGKVVATAKPKKATSQAWVASF